MSKFSRFGVSMMVGASIMLTGSSAYAALDKCQATLEKKGLALTIAAAKALGKCEDAIRKGQLGGDPASKAAGTCEKALAAVLGIPGGIPAAPAPEKTKIGKFLAAIDKADGKGTCTEADLFQLGHLISGISAPGTRGPTCTSGVGACTQDSDCTDGSSCPGSTRFAQYWLTWAQLKVAWLGEIFEVGDSLQLLDAAIEADGSVDCDPAGGKACGTDCTGTPPANHVFRPNLCTFSARTFPQCHIHACNLDTSSGATINPLGLPVGLSDKKLALQLCKTLPGAPLPAGVPNSLRTVVGDPSRGFQPPPVVPISGGIRVCLDQVRAQGWCDCAGLGIPLEPTACQDHIQNNNDPNEVGNLLDDCGDITDNGVEDDCVCAAPAAANCAAPCLACVNSEDGSRCHGGTRNGTPVASLAGASGVGDCSVFNTIALKLVPQGICINAMGDPAGSCTVPGPAPDAGCIMNGGVVCVDADGADGITCTADDLIPPAAPTSIPFTTGTSTSLVTDAVATQGACSGTGMNCATDEDCNLANDPNNPQTCGGGTLTTLSFSAGPGSGISCALLEASQLTGWNIVGSFPALDGAGGLNDTVTTFTLACE